jgi:hypothetical protein
MLCHVRVNARRDLVIDRADHLNRHPVAFNDRNRVLGEASRVRRLRRALERAVDVDGSEIAEVPARALVELPLSGVEVSHRDAHQRA